MEDLTISLIQSNLFWEQPEANMAMFEEKVWEIEDTDLIILPEMFTTGFTMTPKNLAEPPGGRTFKWMRQIASQKKAAVTGSYIVKEGNEFYNRLYFVHPDGSSEQYNKKHLFTLAGENKEYTAGSEKLIVSYKGWKIAPMICYDLRYPVWARSKRSEAADYEYDLIVYVANWPDARINAWDTLLKARAIENLSFSAGVNRTGRDELEKVYPGHSAIYSFKGEEIGISSEETIITSRLSASDLNSFRDQFPFQKDADSFELI